MRSGRRLLGALTLCLGFALFVVMVSRAGVAERELAHIWTHSFTAAPTQTRSDSYSFSPSELVAHSTFVAGASDAPTARSPPDLSLSACSIIFK